MNKKLYRSRKDKMIAGVAGGLAEYFGIDPVLMRVIFILVFFLGGGGLLAYIILWIVVPEEQLVFNMSGSPNTSSDTGTSTNDTNINADQSSANYFENYQKELNTKSKNRSILGGTILIAVGLLFLADNFIPRIHFGDFWPLILIAIGIGLLLNSKKN